MSASQDAVVAELESPTGQVALDSAFYIAHLRIESDCYKEIVKAGALIRVKAPRQMGKTSLMARILHSGLEQGYQAVSIDFRQADGNVFANLDPFLRWFCANVGRRLKLPNKLGDYWDEIFGSKDNCTVYFEEYILPQIKHPLVLGLDELDWIFSHPPIANDFLPLLRYWHERGKNEAIWKKMRLVIVHQDVYTLNANQSPFNVGLPIELPQLNKSQIQDLVGRHGLKWTSKQVEKLMAMVGGHPYLVRMALYGIARREMTLEQLLHIAPTEEGLYSDHLRRHLLNLEENQELLAAMKRVVAENYPVRIDTREASKLLPMGLVKMKGNDVLPLCELYRQYFCDRLRINP